MYAQQSNTGECFLVARCVVSWSSYGPKREIPRQICSDFSVFLFILCLCVHENHKHVHGWNPTTTTSFPERHNNNNNNNKHRETRQNIR